MKKKQRKLLKNFLRNFYILILVIGVIMIWRGIWNLIDLYLFTDYHIASNLVSILIGVLILLTHQLNLESLITIHDNKKD